MVKLKRSRCLKMGFSITFILCLMLLFESQKQLNWSWCYDRFDVRQIRSDTVKQTLPQQCGPGEVVPFHQKFSPVKGMKTLLVSAYQEHRTDKREVRVIAAALRSEEATYHCHLCCQDQLHHSVGFRHHDNQDSFPYDVGYIMCPLPSSCETVSHIALTSAEDDKKFLEVKNQRMKNDSFQYNVTVCYCYMYDYSNALQLLQSLEMLQILGVNKAVIYLVNNSPEVKHLLNYYAQKGFVDLIHWPINKYLNPSRNWHPSISPGDIGTYGQMVSINDCMYKYMYKSRYVAIHDVDELILPQSVQSWLELLPMLKHKYGQDLCFSFENHQFPDSVNLPPPSHQTLPPQGRWDKVPGVNILAHLYKDLKSGPLCPKTIINPRLVFTGSVHYVLVPAGKCIHVDKSLARIYHTRPKRETMSLQNLSYDGRLLDYSSKLIPAVNNALRESGLLPQDSIV